jgi:hypothetical protein
MSGFTPITPPGGAGSQPFGMHGPSQGSFLKPGTDFSVKNTSQSSGMTDSQALGMLGGVSQVLSGVTSIMGAGAEYETSRAINRIMSNKSRAAQQRAYRQVRSQSDKLFAQGRSAESYNALVQAAQAIQEEENKLQLENEVRRQTAKQKRTMSIVGGLFDVGIGIGMMGMAGGA